jgi:hypothetical protein
MAQVAHPPHFIESRTLRSTAAAAARPIQRLFGRVCDALLLANQRQAERDIARFVSTRGRFTDSLEREISNIILGDGWNRRS